MRDPSPTPPFPPCSKFPFLSGGLVLSGVVPATFFFESESTIGALSELLESRCPPGLSDQNGFVLCVLLLFSKFLLHGGSFTVSFPVP